MLSHTYSMNANYFHWQCPVCQQPLAKQDNRLKCEHNHTYDCAKEGYVNLLLAQHRNSSSPGDNKAMVTARRQFLDAGFYQPMADKVVSLVENYFGIHAIPDEPLQLFDAGCGEGYYLNHLINGLKTNGYSAYGCGIDISKFAVQKAAKRYKENQFAVASSFNIPLADNSQDAVIQVFAPSSEEEIKRILKPHGIWIDVNPGPSHLHQIKAFVYDNPQSHEPSLVGEEGFELLEYAKCEFEFELTQPEIRESLLMMTPFYWQISEQKKQSLKAQLTKVQAAFVIRVMKINSL